MKRLFVLLVTVLVIYVIYFDLTTGTLPVAQIESIDVKTTKIATIPYFEKKISSGETVLTIVEGYMDGPLPVSITQMIADFKKLNNGLQPEQLKSGRIYRFPDYKQ